jgi:hypothetical protein
MILKLSWPLGVGRKPIGQGTGVKEVTLQTFRSTVVMRVRPRYWCQEDIMSWPLGVGGSQKAKVLALRV